MTIDRLVNKTETRSNRRGFTIIELGATIGTLTVMAIVAYGGYLGIISLRKYMNQPVVERANVICGPEAELFIDKDGRRFYAEIDGKPVSDYIRQQK